MNIDAIIKYFPSFAHGNQAGSLHSKQDMLTSG